jgi:transcriptional regulator with XRE-family HTH domain
MSAPAVARSNEPSLEIRGCTSGELLRTLRKQQHLVLRDVAEATRRIAKAQDNEEFAISPGRLSQVENKGAVPSIYRLYALSVVYHIDLRELLYCFRIPRE